MCKFGCFHKGSTSALKFYLDRVVPINLLGVRKLETLGYPTAKTAFLYVPFV